MPIEEIYDLRGMLAISYISATHAQPTADRKMVGLQILKRPREVSPDGMAIVGDTDGQCVPFDATLQRIGCNTEPK